MLDSGEDHIELTTVNGSSINYMLAEMGDLLREEEFRGTFLWGHSRIVNSTYSMNRSLPDQGVRTIQVRTHPFITHGPVPLWKYISESNFLFVTKSHWSGLLSDSERDQLMKEFSLYWENENLLLFKRRLSEVDHNIQEGN
jgi:hypothetical protein